ncbi:LysM peptidoglycan-binding domain-containing protein [Nocardioides marmoribigeumensis]|uniref:Tfp pilus assembly protein FimV n=1 Tax=Nocardioides marmoribigeumensis TaxID=433649 RepID=A0ABU2BR67_9ACTN|nr:LysM peptidoglycan-binding domain-containing protein [Nocardioides marmoribigeumensis]MDR7360479.1 Tfp pilus assembly protein FimV [Nocardioides marmoribigeumensis]
MSTMVIAGGRRTVASRPVPQVRVGQVRQVRQVRPVETDRAPVRLTRRGRLVLTLVLTVMVVLGLLAAGGASFATREAGDPQPIRTVEVERGQTLWGIAATIAEPGEVRDMVYTIERLNSLPDATLTEGQVLAVPRG